MMEEELTFVVRPYQFEPQESDFTDSSDESSESEAELSADHDHAMSADEWCSCSNCVVMPTERECKCCKTYPACADMMGDLNCITEHEGFQANCLNRHVLTVAFYEFLDDYGAVGDDEPVHELFRYIAYRKFVRWIWHKLGKKNRRVIPACAVTKIRQAFPSESYSGFKYPRDY